jgi:colicin V production protein
MTWLDIVVLGLVGGGLVKGWHDGFVRQVAVLGAVVAVIYCCSRVAHWLRALVLSAGWVSEGSVTFVSYAGAFVLILAAVRLAGRWVDHKVDDSPLNIPNRLAGALCAASVALFIISFTLNLIEGLDRRGFLLTEETKSRSRTYPFIRETVPAVFSPKLFVWREE